jgi:phosphatidylserine decarboxylase
VLKILPPIHPEGVIFGSIFFIVTLVLGHLFVPLGWIGFVLTLWCFYFFRNPKRFTPTREGLIISPADGVVQSIQTMTPPKSLGLDGERVRVSIFMNVFNVHVNRIPFGGVVKKILYHPGKFLNASLDKASEHNERQSIVLETENKQLIAFTQIAGLIARRIRCDVQEGQEVQTGEVFGLIRFGSRVDVFLPPKVNPLVCVGQTMVAGETVIADFESGEAARHGEIR